MELMASTLTNQIAQQPKANERSQATSDVRKASSNSEEKNSFQSKLNEKKSWAPDRGRSSKLDPSPRRRALPKQVGQNQSSSRNSHQEVVDPNVRKSREPARKNGKAEAVDSLTRRAALQSFMMKMKQDLDVNPGEVVSALMALTPQQLQLPPKLNIEHIVQQLELDPVAAEKAKVYFDQMLAESSANSMADYLKGSKRQLSLEVMSQAEQRQSHLESSLQQMNSQFFAAPSSQDVTAAQAKQASDQQSMANLLAAMGVGGSAAGLSGQAQAIAGGQQPLSPFVNQQQLAAQMAEGSEGLANAESASVMSDSGFAASESQGAAKLMQSMTSLEGSKAATSSAGLAAYGMSATPKVSLPINSESVTSDVMASDSNGFTVAEAGGGQSQAESSLDGFTNSDGGEQEMGAEGFEGGEDIQFSVRTADAGTKSQSIEKAAATSSAFSLAPEPTEAEQAKNVREIMQQTQFLMKKGGGEAKVTLNPEGLGQIQLKVSTEGEQVAVDMVAESSEAKKLIEKGLGDLKATLASHKLNVENLKVDLASDIQKQFDHAHDEAQRQSAQQFMESFREQNGAWRQSFLDMPGVRMPGSRGAEDGLTLETLEERKKSSSSRRLDLVA